MKKIRGMVILFVVLSIFSIILIFLLELANIEELVLGALFGSLISIAISLFVEYSNYSSEKRRAMDEYFWNVVNPYRESLGELFLYARDLYYIDFMFEGISKEEGNWTAYEALYKNNELKIDKIIVPYSRLVSETVRKNLNIISNSSIALSKIDREDLFGRESQDYQKAYKIYHIIENINLSLEEAYERFEFIENIKDESEKRCSQIIVCRWLSDLLCNNYDRGIRDLTDEEVEKSFNENEYNDLVAKKDLDLAISDYAKNIR